MQPLIDFHSHILPGIDDGSRSVQQSLEMLHTLAGQGVTHVVLTPHFYAQTDHPEHFFAKRTAALEQLQSAMQGLPDLPFLSVGAEVYYFIGMGQSEILRQMAIDGGKFVLIEPPMSPWPERVYRDLEAMTSKLGLTPIIAHIDRYIRPFHTCGILKRLENMPVLIQANADFFLHPRTRQMALKLLKQGRIQLLGSDCHNMTDRAPNLGSAAAWIAGKGEEKHLDTIYRQAMNILGGTCNGKCTTQQ